MNTGETITGSRDRLTTLLLFLVFSLLYVSTLCRTVFTGDSGEISTAIVTQGIIHPPGYPLFALLGNIALVVVPFGEPAFRIGWVAALAGAAAVAVLFRFCRSQGVALIPAAATAVLFGASFDVWSQCVRVEVYSLHTLLYGLAILNAASYGKYGGAKNLYAAAIAFSLGLAHHLTIVLFLPGLLLLAGPRLWTEAKVVPRITSLAATILTIGPAFYLLLIYWASRDPIFNWSRPKTFPALLNHVSARIYAGNFQFPTPEKMARIFQVASTSLATDLVYLGVVLAIGGVLLLWTRERRIAAGLLLIVATVLVYNTFYAINDIVVYFLPVLWIASFFSAITLTHLLDLLHVRQVRQNIGLTVIAILPLFQLLRTYRECDLSQVTSVREIARQKLRHCDPDGVLLLQYDNDSFPIDYVRYVLKERTDVLPLDRAAFKGSFTAYAADPSEWYLHGLRKQGITVEEISTDRAERQRQGDDGVLIGLLERLSATRPLHTTFLDDKSDEERQREQATGVTYTRPLITWFRTRFEPVPQGLVVRLRPKSESIRLPELIARNKSLWETTTIPDFARLTADNEIDRTYFSDHYASMLLSYGFLYEMNKEPQNALVVYDIVRQFAPDNKQLLTTLANFKRRYPNAPTP